MKTRLIWKKCDIMGNKNTFWLECTDEEVDSQIIPLVLEKKLTPRKNVETSVFLEMIKANRGFDNFHEDLHDESLCNFFLVSCDLKFIESFQWTMPYSGQWNASNPFRRIEVCELESIEQLLEIKPKIAK